MKKAWVALVTAVAVFGLAGCGTVKNLEDRPMGYFRPKGDAEKRVYGGVRIDAEWASGYFVRDGDWFLGTYLLAVDLPLCAVADTMTLPITLCAAWTAHRDTGQGHDGTKTLPEEQLPRR